MACLAAGLTTVLFAVGTSDVTSGDPDRISRILELVELTATHSAVFAAPFEIGRASCRERVLWYV